MLRLLELLIYGYSCNHRWKILHSATCECDWGSRYTRHYLQCEKCGKVKHT